MSEEIETDYDVLGESRKFPKRKYWTFKHRPGKDRSEEQCMEYIYWALRKNVCMMQYEYGHEDAGQPKGKVTQNWNKMLQIKEGDVVFLMAHKIYAVGIVRKHDITSSRDIPCLSVRNDIIAKGQHGDNNQYQSYDFDGQIVFSDTPVFYEDLSDGEDGWGQRVMVCQWLYFSGTGIGCGNEYYNDGDVYSVVREVNPRFAKELINELAQNYKEKNKMVIETAEMLKTCKNLVLTGAPGTGKTYLARQIAAQMILGKAVTGEDVLSEADTKKLKEQIGFVQFHPSMDYTDLVEGLRPVVFEDVKNLGFERRDGVFKSFCKRAIAKLDDNYVFVIDEINRGDIAKIFGELFFAIDPGYRGIKGRIRTQYDNLIEADDAFKDGFYVPDNVYIIGTMNDIDRGVESMDFAIRRRFTWKDVKPEETQEAILRSKIKNGELFEMAKNRMDNLNAAISDTNSGLGNAYCIGGAYFTKNVSDDGDSCDFAALWKYHLEPLLREYLRGQETEVIRDRMKAFEEAYNTEEPLSRS